MRSKKELIEKFIATLNTVTEVDKDWKIFADENRKQDLDKIIEEEGLKPEQAYKFINDAFRDGELKSTGIAFAGILPQKLGFGNARAQKKSIVLDKLRAFFEKYSGI